MENIFLRRTLFVFIPLLFVTFLSFPQGKIAFKSKDNISLFYSTKKTTKNWINISINASPTKSLYTLHAENMDAPVSFEITDAYKLDDSYYAIPVTMLGSKLYFIFSRQYSRALLVSDNKKTIPLKVELTKVSIDGNQKSEGQVKLENMISLLELLI
ncbi:hypothetical protein [Sphingobacterium sp. LRF_L2]|uniref:hypothetical protein n=1 Tax=Sphingobacterium sp. LRF_L2 TaxID=3369421 RepID=UPI003F5E16DB